MPALPPVTTATFPSSFLAMTLSFECAVTPQGEDDPSICRWLWSCLNMIDTYNVSMTDTISLFRAFIRVVEAGSFTRVAHEQNSSQPTISRQVAALEEHLGARLFTRTTRKLTLTDDGRGFYERAKVAIEAVSEAEDAVGRRRSRPSGSLRLAMPVVFGRLRVIPHLKEFLSRYPDVTIDLVM